MGWNSTSSKQGVIDLPKEFQFPMGWNSTRYFVVNVCVAYVSIPNGMEFYDAHGGSIDTEALFQFPMGWNSTLKSPPLAPLLKRFNSQWDGILRAKNKR